MELEPPRIEPQASNVRSGQSGGAAPTFDVDTAVLLAGFAFEVYNEPSENDARWERGADGCDVAFMSEAFACECYAGRLEVRLREAKELATEQDLAQTLLSGGNVDPYVVFALNEEVDKGPKEGAIALQRAVDRARSSTRWSKSLADQWKDKGKPKGSAEWGEDEIISLYVKEPSAAQLAMTVFDEEVAAEDRALGAASLRLGAVLDAASPDGARRQWQGWVPLTWRPAETQDNTVNIGAVAGAFVAGPVGAAAGGFLGSLIKKPAQGQLYLELKYEPLLAPAQGGAPDGGGGGAAAAAAAAATAAAYAGAGADAGAAAAAAATAAYAAAAADAGGGGAADGAGPDAGADADAPPAFNPVLASRAAPKGASEGLDWSELSQRVGVLGVDENDFFELCCFVSHKETSTEAAIWRDTNRRQVVLSFRGTSDVVDIVTDVNILQTPLEQRADGGKSDDTRKVHAGFFAGATAVSRRLKELLVSACEGTPGEWELLITGHSLGGALATLVAPDLAAGVDTSRGFRARKDTSWFGAIADALGAAGRQAGVVAEAPRLNSVRIYTFGAPRVGNSEFARYFDEAFAGKEAFRIVNGEDIVARMPRHGNSAGAVLDYEHCGRTAGGRSGRRRALGRVADGRRTVLIDEDAAQAAGFAGFWIEGQSADAACPLRDVSPLTNPFSERNLLGSAGQTLSQAASRAWGGIDGAAKIKSRKQLEAAMGEAAAELERARDAITSRVASMDPLEVVSVLGLDKDFVESELKMIDSLRKGTAVTHHLEPSYFVALKNALDAARPETAAAGPAGARAPSDGTNGRLA